MLHFIIANELHNLFYILSASLIHLIIAPHFMHKERQLTLFFACILGTFIFLYWNFADIDPLIYSLQLVPVCLLFVTLSVGIVPAIMTWIVFNMGCMFVLNYYWEPALLSSTFLLILGFLVRNRVTHASLLIKLTYATAILLVYELLYAPLAPYVLAPISLYASYVIGCAFISLWIMIAILYFINKYEMQRNRITHLDKNRMLAELSATVSHEIRNPLTSTRGFLQLLLRSDLSNTDRRRYVDYALTGVDQAISLLTDFLNFAKPSLNLQEQLDIKEELEHTIRFITPYAIDFKITIDISHDSEAPLYILGESQKLRQCLLNLVKNAIEAMPNGGRLSLRTCKHPSAVQISIEDTGVGMTDKQLSALGKPYYTTKEHGTGLGLVVVISLIKKMNGKISFSSSLNRGTQCSIVFQQY